MLSDQDEERIGVEIGSYRDPQFVELYAAVITVILQWSIVEKVPFFPAKAWKPAEDAYMLLVKKQRGDTDC
jgi:hypothetical protein